MTDGRLVIEGEIKTHNVTVQVRHYGVTSRLEETTVFPDHTLTRALGPTRYSANRGSSRFAGFGEIFLVPAGMPLKYKGLGGPYRHLACRLDTCAFEALTGLGDEWDKSLLDSCWDIRTPEIDSVLRRLAKEALTPSFASEILVDSLATTMMIDLARYLRVESQVKSLARGGLATWQLRRIREQVEELSDNPLTVARLADHCGISSGHLMRAFRQATGETVHKYVERVRMKQAEQLLRETTLPVKLVAAKVGFNQTGSFSLAFRRATGATPSCFRQLMRASSKIVAIKTPLNA